MGRETLKDDACGRTWTYKNGIDRNDRQFCCKHVNLIDTGVCGVADETSGSISIFHQLNNFQLWRNTVTKVKQSHNTLMAAQREMIYSSYSFKTSALDGGDWWAPSPGRALPPGKGPPVPSRQEAGWASELVWTRKLEEKSSCLCRGYWLGVKYFPNCPVVIDTYITSCQWRGVRCSFL
jgi:hypothetical protein